MKFPSACLLLAIALSAGTARSETTEAILARMDKAAPAFTGVIADLKMTTFTKILADSTVETGTLKMQRSKANQTLAVVDFSASTDARILSFEGKNVRIFYPKLNEYNEYSLGKNGNVLNQFLLLGFGSSGKDLSANYEITGEGTETVGSVTATKLLLVPRAGEVKDKIAKVEIWIPEGGTSPIQQQFFEPSGNYKLVLYSNVVLNPSGLKLQGRPPEGARKRKNQ